MKAYTSLIGCWRGQVRHVATRRMLSSMGSIVKFGIVQEESHDEDKTKKNTKDAQKLLTNIHPTQIKTNTDTTMTLGKSFIHGVPNSVERNLRSCILHDPSLRLIASEKVLYRNDKNNDKVILISGGGSGHEPAHAGYLGEGALDVIIAGEIFASPSASQIHTGLQTVKSSKGSLMIVKNYTGDKLNFGLAAEKAKAEGQRIETVVVGDDVSVQGNSLVGQRGLAGTVFCHKIAGAKAAQGASLDQVAAVTRKAASQMATVAASLDRCSVPGRTKQEGLPHDQLEFGMGIHNEPGFQREEISSLETTVKKTLDMMFTPKEHMWQPEKGQRVALMVNNLGGLSVLELGVVADEVVTQLLQKDVRIERSLVGTFVTSLDGPGFSVTLLSLDDELTKLLDAPTTAPAWPRSIHRWATDAESVSKRETTATPPKVIDRKTGVKVPASLIKILIESVSRTMARDEPRITEYDTLAGDGDCGETLLKGVTGLLKEFQNDNMASIDIGQIFRRTATIAERSMGGTSGAIYAIFLNAVANRLYKLTVDSPSLGVSELIQEALQSGLDELCRYTPARIGHRTLMDALIPFVKNYTLDGSLKSALAEARKGAESTRQMTASLGRASYVGQDRFDEEGGIPDPGALGVPAKHKRTRSGCLNCRRKKRKCDEGRPACGTCRRRNEPCEWGLKIAFRAEHAQCLNARHPSMRKMARRRPPREFEILDITDEVIRDYNGAETEEEDGSHADRHTRSSNDDRSSLVVNERPSETSSNTTEGYVPVPVQRPPVINISSPASQRRTENAVADLLYFSQNGQAHNSVDIDPALHVSMDTVPIDIITEYPYMDQLQAFTPEGASEDGIFLPGSAYHELHSTLRNHLIQETRSIAPTRSTTPHIEPEAESGGATLEETEVALPINDFQPSQTPLLSQQEECSLWKNYFDEIAPWLDKFDRDRHFQQIIPTMSKDNDHLRYSMLALSARQLELKHTLSTSRSLALYQEAIHLLLPHLPTRGTAVIATCVILCVLEMLSCSPKAWQRHLDGCASLMEAVGINGFVGGTEQALFWCFARMDICGGLISSVKTLIPISHWASKTLSIENDVELFKNASTFENWANYAVYLTAQVLDLLAPSPSEPTRNEAKFRTRWLKTSPPHHDDPVHRNLALPDDPVLESSSHVRQPNAPYRVDPDASKPALINPARSRSETEKYPLACKAGLRYKHVE
ncbi:dak2-dihydroxyacetone kinase [Fusarium flagelliforme]|uniref:Dak2-dihydroxyacetone kinase n=1 Tax=Fusarium flagelliforme TaxID=2675880 RepID=A0A395M956_9HYPO|nr:dak2-dihydroxyacetone kinase [Fusarium flagelliforme]